MKIGFKHVLLAPLGLWVVLSPSVADTNNNLPDLGDESGALISPFEERRLGEDFMRKARQRLDFIDDPELLDYLQSLGDKLVAQSGDKDQDFLFSLVNNTAINAFAVPGGFITAHTGLVLAAETEAELAAVLAHEIAHITQRHIPRIFAAQKRSAAPAMAALLAAILLLQAGQTEGGEAAIALSTASMVQSRINFTRTHEEEADRVGTQVLAKAGYDPRAMPSMFRRMQSWGRLYETNLPEFLRTHPLTLRRIAESENRANQYPKVTTTDNSAYDHFRAKIRAISGDPKTTAGKFEENLAARKYNDVNAERYGYVLALTRNKQYNKARDQAKNLVRLQPENVYHRIAQAEIEMSAGRYKQALDIFSQAYQRNPKHHALLRAYTASLLKTRNYKKARTIAKQAVQLKPADPGLHKMLATASGQSGFKLEAHQAMAEYYYLSGNPAAAVRQLELANRYTGDSFYLRSSLDAKIKAIMEEVDRYKKH